MASRNYKHEKQHTICRHISDPKQNLGPLGPLGENKKASVHLGPNSPFHKISANWHKCSLFLCAVKHSVQNGGIAWSEPHVVSHQGGADLGLSPESFP